MKKLNQILADQGTKVLIVLLLLCYFKTCSISSDLSKVKKRLIVIDSLPTHSQVENAIKIEGLKAEKRMIQSTDRKMLDVNRQSQIDAELSGLEKNNKP